MKVIIGSDHAGFSMKSQVKTVLEDMGHSVEDVGCHSEDSVDYPVYGKAVAAGIARGEFSRGILVCGSGLGMSMIANRFVGVRAALCNDLYSAVVARMFYELLSQQVIHKTSGPAIFHLSFLVSYL
jgi:ribose 5-phosphate isomerase B